MSREFSAEPAPACAPTHPLMRVLERSVYRGPYLYSAIAAGMRVEHVRRDIDEREAMGALSMAGPEDLVVLMPTDVAGSWKQVQEFVPGPGFGPSPGGPADAAAGAAGVRGEEALYG
ncbi:hypothetical protein [Cryobacterium tepidiphilum]|nr:hypothetical protein [Cryobacterium tepidiphilum]